MTLPRNIEPLAIRPEEEARLDLEQRSAADDLLINHFDDVIDTALNNSNYSMQIFIHNIYHLSGQDELLAVHDLKSLLFNTALEIVKRGE